MSEQWDGKEFNIHQRIGNKTTIQTLDASIWTMYQVEELANDDLENGLDAWAISVNGEIVLKSEAWEDNTDN